MSEHTKDQKAELKARRKAEKRSQTMTKLANRTFSKEPNFLDRMAMKMLTKAIGSSAGDDPELDHDGPIKAFE